MNFSTVIFLINKHVRCVLATYEQDPDTKRTPFKTFDPHVAIGDYVIVPTTTRHGMTVVKIVDTDVDVDFDNSAPMAWIIGRVDRGEYEKNLSQEGDAVTKIRQADSARKRDELRDVLLSHNGGIKSLPIYDIGNGDVTGDPTATLRPRGGF